MTEYFIKLRTISDGLALAGSPLSNTDLITHLITGLDHSYYPVVVYIEANMLTMDLSEAYAMLLTHEARLENNKIVDSKEAKSNYMANVAQTRNFQMKGGFGGNRKNFAQGGVMCQIFFRYDHIAADCRDRFSRNFAPSFPIQGYHPNQGPKSAYMATSEEVADQGNGQGLQITHVGNACLYTSFGSCIHLHNTLCVPKITKNFISVSKLLSDSDITIEFSSDACFLKYKVKGTLLAQEIVEGGQYKLLSYEE
ncbi:uncharacterized protein LOC112098179 [Citrus clementina]|uniref:uncharacterized protein LOC112098179 n=1 Tax=Citrus clementina TaxID=85681 RepID=UPI0007637B7A|nr:uncharacterized protein LOC112098179 [Citrus x clementina]